MPLPADALRSTRKLLAGAAQFNYERLAHPPATFLQEKLKAGVRLPAARRFILENGIGSAKVKAGGNGTVLSGSRLVELMEKLFRLHFMYEKCVKIGFPRHLLDSLLESREFCTCHFDDPATAIEDPTRGPASTVAQPTTGPLQDGGLVVNQTSGSGKSGIYLLPPKYQLTANALDLAPTDSAPTAAQIRAEIDASSTQLAAILEDTAVIGALGAGLTALATATAVADLHTDVGTALTNISDLHTDVGTTLANLATVDGIADTILVDTAELQTDWTNGGRLDLLLDSVVAAAAVGSITFTYTLTNASTGLPIADALIEVYTDANMTNLVRSGRTSVLGVATFYLDAGTYYLKRSKAGFTFTNPDTEIVA